MKPGSKSLDSLMKVWKEINLDCVAPLGSPRDNGTVEEMVVGLVGEEGALRVMMADWEEVLLVDLDPGTNSLLGSVSFLCRPLGCSGCGRTAF